MWPLTFDWRTEGERERKLWQQQRDKRERGGVGGGGFYEDLAFFKEINKR